MGNVLKVTIATAFLLVASNCQKDRSGLNTGKLPVIAPAEYPEVASYRIRNLISQADINGLIATGSDSGFAIDASHITRLLDGSRIHPKRLYGRCYFGPYDFESKETDYGYSRLRLTARVRQGRGVLKVFTLFKPRYNAEKWKDRGELRVKFELMEKRWGKDRRLGAYDTRLRFRLQDSVFVCLPSIMEGPFINAVNSVHPDSIVISFTTAPETRAAVVLSSGRSYSTGKKASRHLIPVTSLRPGTGYSYQIEIDGIAATPQYDFVTAPLRTAARVTFAYAGDSREGVGAGEQAFMGVNREALDRLLSIAYHKGAGFLAMGGDLMNGYTTGVTDFAMQLSAYKNAAAAFRRRRCIYPAMGNHETLLRVFDDNSKRGIALDRWPYASESAEHLFRKAFLNPQNAPVPSDSRRPTYTGSCYSYDYGPVRMISFNNNYWYANHPEKTGGCPEGYILSDQMQWIKAQLEAAENDPQVRHVFLYAQEPVFPCGGHAGDAMWYGGNNNKRAWIKNRSTGQLQPAGKGIVEVRNTLARLVSEYRKVAAVLGSDEHAYYRLLIDSNVPVGIPEKDDANQDDTLGQAGESISPMADLKYPVWYITSGGAGAPYYSEEALPWNSYWKSKKHSEWFYFFSSQSHIVLFEIDGARVGCTAYNPYGEVVDRVADLKSVKR